MEENPHTVVHGDYVVKLNRPLRMLSAWQIQKIDRILEDVGPFAEVRLIKQRGKLRFIEKLESENLLEPHGVLELAQAAESQ